MKIFLVFFLCITAVNSGEYHYNKPNVVFYLEDLQRPGPPAYNPTQQSMIIQGNFGKNYEITMVPSTKVFETRLQQNIVTEAQNLPYQSQHISQPQKSALTSPNPGFYTNPFNTNFQQQPTNQYTTINEPQQNQYMPLNQPQQNPITNQYHPSFNINSYAANAQQHFNEYTNVNQQQEQGVISTSQQQPAGLFSQQQQQQNSNNVQNSNNLLYDLVNNNKYVSQSEASQLDVYPYKQLTIGNTRPFTRIITNCDANGHCEQQNVAEGGDFQHQQVLKQSKAKIEPISDKCKGYHYSPNSLNSQNTFPKGISARKGSNLRDRRLFPYSEQVIAQYPTN